MTHELYSFSSSSNSLVSSMLFLNILTSPSEIRGSLVLHSVVFHSVTTDGKMSEVVRMLCWYTHITLTCQVTWSQSSSILSCLQSFFWRLLLLLIPSLKMLSFLFFVISMFNSFLLFFEFPGSEQKNSILKLL